MKINGVDCKAVTHGSCVDILRKAGNIVNLTVGRKNRPSTLSDKSIEVPPPITGNAYKLFDIIL